MECKSCFLGKRRKISICRLLNCRVVRLNSIVRGWIYTFTRKLLHLLENCLDGKDRGRKPCDRILNETHTLSVCELHSISETYPFIHLRVCFVPS